MLSGRLSRRRVLFGLGAGGMAAAGSVALAAAVSKAAESSSSQVRTGTVVAFSGPSISVRFAGGAVQDFPYVRGYDPILGEEVVLVANGSAWLVVAGLNGMPPDNPVLNPGFEDGPGTPGWGKHDFDGATSLDDRLLPDPTVEGVRCAELSTVAVSIDTVVYSSAIAVQPGQLWSADCYVMTVEGATNDAVPFVQLLLAFFTSAAAVYPTTPLAEAILSLQSLPARMSHWSLMRPVVLPGDGPAGVPVPDTATHMRVAVRFSANHPTESLPILLMDRVVARRIS